VSHHGSPERASPERAPHATERKARISPKAGVSPNVGARSTLQVSERGDVVYLHVAEACPPGKQASDLASQLSRACADIAQRADWPAAVVLTAGGDAFWVRPPESAEDCAPDKVWAAATRALGSLGPPTITAIDGDALGLAWDLALACDLRIATARARVGSPEIKWGCIPSAGATQRLRYTVGPAIATRLLLLGEVVEGPAALDLGLVQRLAPAGELAAGLEQLLDPLRSAAPIALAFLKEAARSGSQMPLDAGLRLEADLSALLQTTGDRAEGIRAFNERRAPQFKGQ